MPRGDRGPDQGGGRIRDGWEHRSVTLALAMGAGQGAST
jgi:hypothetical protein